MRALTVEFLEMGALPIYDLNCRWTQTFLDFEGPLRWEHLGNISRRRVIVQLWMEDVLLVDLRDRLTEWLGWLDDQDGSLIFPIRGIHELPETDENPAYGPFIMAGLTFCPGIDFGYPLDGEDPVDIIVQTCEADGVDNDALHPAALHARQQRVEQRIRWEASIAEDRAKRAIVNARSLALLRDCLTPPQLDELEAYVMFHVTCSDGYTYAIEKGYGYNVHRVEDGERTCSYCIHPKGRIPSYDLMLGLKLMLEACPERFHAIANYQRLVA